jgi:hypothetical protein
VEAQPDRHLLISCAYRSFRRNHHFLDSSADVKQEGVEIPPGLQKALNALRSELNITGHDLGF